MIQEKKKKDITDLEILIQHLLLMYLFYPNIQTLSVLRGLQNMHNT